MSDSQLQLVLTRYNTWENDSDKSDYIDQLEDMIEKCNVEARNGGELVPDSVYDTLIDYLTELSPESPLLHQVWTEDDDSVPLDMDLDVHLIRHPMLSIQTIKSLSDKPLKSFQQLLPVGDIEIITSAKENGHAARVVWSDGHLVKATSRGRSTNGRDLTNQAQLVLGEYCEEFDGLGVVEMRCEILLPFNRLEEARSYNPKIKSAFTGVSSMIRASASEEETLLLDFVFYDIFCDDLEFEKKSDKYEYIEQAGFLTPAYMITSVSSRTLEQDIENVLIDMDESLTDYQYYTDGVVFEVNDIELFDELGAEERFRYGNLALKMGRWKQDAYQGVVGHISWEKGKSKLTPVAVLEEGVVTANGNTVTNVPLYAPLYILLLGCYPGEIIHFKYGGEAGVVPITHDGRLVTDKGLRE